MLVNGPQIAHPWRWDICLWGLYFLNPIYFRVKLLPYLCNIMLYVDMLNHLLFKPLITGNDHITITYIDDPVCRKVNIMVGSPYLVHCTLQARYDPLSYSQPINSTVLYFSPPIIDQSIHPDTLQPEGWLMANLKLERPSDWCWLDIHPSWHYDDTSWDIHLHY